MSTHTMNPAAAPVTEHYGDQFYEDQIGDSEQSAREYVPHLMTLLQPQAVLDVGCGRGAWLKVFAEQGVTRVVGFDGPWNRAEDMIEPRIEFHPIDLDMSFAGRAKVDLSMSLEVAEHLKPDSSKVFVESLVASADAVMFGAAYSGQGGANHINERPHSFWGRLFDAAGYDAFDVFRPTFWGNERICYWYRQNTFLYARRGSSTHQGLNALGLPPVPNLAFLDCVHPQLFERVDYQPPPTLPDVLKQIGPALVRSVRYRLTGRVE